MPAPFPYDAVAGVPNDPAESEAVNLYNQYKWIARWSNEINQDAVNLNLKKLAQLTFHCRKFRVWYDALQAHITAATHTATEIGNCIEGVWLARDLTWGNRSQMNSDITAVYDGSGVFYDWVKANQQQARNYTTAQFDENFENQTDVPIVISMPAAVATRVAALRGLFA